MSDGVQREEPDWEACFGGIKRRYAELAKLGNMNRVQSFVEHVRHLQAWEDHPLDYPELTATFPDSVDVAFAVCHPDCGTCEFIVEGSTQECQRCGRHLFRLEMRTYRLDPLPAPQG